MPGEEEEEEDGNSLDRDSTTKMVIKKFALL